MNRLAGIAALAALAPLAGGCVAAIIPLYAGAAMVKSSDREDGSDGDAPSVQASMAAPAASSGAVAMARSDLKAVPTSLTSLPPPDAPAPTADPAIARFQSYALAQAEQTPGTAKRTSAIVSDPSALKPARGSCGAQPPAVFVDLDPGRGTFDPLSPGAGDPALSTALTALRDNGVKVVWFSRLSASFAEPARDILKTSGLDPAGADELVLMRDLDERKQSLRDEAAKRLCPIAMLGDERADFDELYLYLRDDSAALPLDVMIGQGWFIANPFVQSPAIPAGDTP